MQLLKIGVGLQVRIGFGERKKLAQRPRQHIFGSGLLCRPLRRRRGIARFYHLVERAALVRGITLHRLDEIGNEVMSLAQLDVDIGKTLVDPLPHGHEAVVDSDDPQDDDNNYGQDDQC